MGNGHGLLYVGNATLWVEELSISRKTCIFLCPCLTRLGDAPKSMSSILM